ncbi:unnamed protein product [Amoebophrya sp. A25]|nr:unnamed protein product [Amoebophrya sp. A25]|eukprot:GSA25T00001972001.1
MIAMRMSRKQCDNDVYSLSTRGLPAPELTFIHVIISSTSLLDCLVHLLGVWCRFPLRTAS